ncbi:MAG: fibrillarin-like rRNA/tRNA 2'-O-methyltransferase [Thermoplasmata archaeon]|nr:fibrillarin-like rRNA/tRNA 2'-O-methyltransferase [Thermoplasmata archaeon]
MAKIRETPYFGVYSDGENFYTLNAVSGTSVYGEVLVREKDREYRRWNPMRSKLSAMLHKKLKNFAFQERTEVLYLGAASGTTVSHISDILTRGRIYAVEISRTPFVGLLKLAEVRKNIVPLLADASKTYTYSPVVQKVDVIYQDIAQKNQVEIFVEAAKECLRENGTGYLIIKAPAIDSTKKAGEVLKFCMTRIEENGLKICEKLTLEPFDADHGVLVIHK